MVASTPRGGRVVGAAASQCSAQVDEDEVAGLGVETSSGPLVLAENPNGCDIPIGDVGARGEGCSCLYGNPCQDQYVCKNWANRFEVAKKNGWKGFS